MPFAVINTTRYYYELHGQGQPLVLISGYGCDHHYWQYVYPKLAEHFQVLIFDNRGSGQTEDDGSELSSTNMAHDTAALIDALQLKKPHVVGQSMGGTIAQMFAIHHGDKIDKLALLNTTAYWRKPMLMLFDQWLQHVKDGDIHALNDLALLIGFGDQFLQDNDKVSAFLEMANNLPNPQSYRNAARQYQVLAEHDARKLLNAINNESLVVLSEEDLISPQCDAQFIADHLAKAQLKTIAGGHSSCNDQPSTVIETLKNFLA